LSSTEAGVVANEDGPFLVTGSPAMTPPPWVENMLAHRRRGGIGGWPYLDQ
jgi:hypothetical protein